MREMFIEKGFNDFLAKPVDISKLDEMLTLWIPKEKRVKGEDKGEKAETIEAGKAKEEPVELQIPGVDVKQGIAMTGGKLEFFIRVLKLFCKDAEKRLPLLEKAPEEDALDEISSQAHAIKGVSASIRANDLSALAAEVEAAGKAGDIETVRERLPKLTEEITELVKNIKSALNIP